LKNGPAGGRRRHGKGKGNTKALPSIKAHTAASRGLRNNIAFCGSSGPLVCPS